MMKNVVYGGIRRLLQHMKNSVFAKFGPDVLEESRERLGSGLEMYSPNIYFADCISETYLVTSGRKELED